MRDNGERIYAGMMDREDMQTLEAENSPPEEGDFRWETDKNRLSQLINGLMDLKEDVL